MGGLIILLSIAVGTLLWAKLNNTFVIKALFVLLWFGTLGAWDDWLKLTRQLRNTGRDGLKSWEKPAFPVRRRRTGRVFFIWRLY